MNLLLDTHFAFWLALDPTRMTAVEQAMVRDAANDVAVSTVSLWELRIKWEKRFVSGARKGDASPADVFTALARLNVPVAPIYPAHAIATLLVPAMHKDPFDEQLLVHAQELGMMLLTRDSALAGHPLVVTPGAP